ncbi:MAG: hypothetical protein AB7J13_00945 [Pyrinomonadaceae bacterium]
MKLLIGMLILAASAVCAAAQAAAQPAALATKQLMEYARAKDAVKNSPFTADEVNESVQTLADGNRIVRSSTGKIYRNSEGRIRRDISGGVGGMLGTTYSFGSGVSIVNPSVGQKYLLDSELKTARVIELERASKELALVSGRLATDAERELAIAKLRGEMETKVRQVAPAVIAGVVGSGSYATSVSVGQGGVLALTSTSKYESRTEELGTRDFGGFSADGTRKVTTIPAGAIGNEREIEIVYERWFSKELGMVVHSRNSDPRFGEQTYTLTNLIRTEPDPSLFSIPTHYRKIAEPSPTSRVSPRAVASPVSVRTPASLKPRPQN